jgi:RNA polymerase II subunit A small phosphatase-like protein
MNSRLLILDLDETLIFGTEEKLHRAEDFRVGPYFVYKRPGLDRFIDFALMHFGVAVWTASSADYADESVRRTFGDAGRLKFVWSRERCTRKRHPELSESYWVKDLKKVRRLGYSLEHVVVVDDTSRKLERSYGNHVCIIPFEGDPADTELARLESYLFLLKDVPNIRAVDMRSWRTARIAVGTSPSRK